MNENQSKVLVRLIKNQSKVLVSLLKISLKYEFKNQPKVLVSLLKISLKSYFKLFSLFTCILPLQSTLGYERYNKHFIAAKKIEGCSDRTVTYYKSTVEHLLKCIDTPIRKITTDEIRWLMDTAIGICEVMATDEEIFMKD